MFRKISFGIGVVIIAIVSLPFLLLVKMTNNKNLALKCIHVMCKTANWFAGNKMHVKGIENLKQSDDYVLVANHLSFFDIISLMAIMDKPIVFIAKDSLTKIPIISSWFKTLDTIFLDRDDKKSGMIMLKAVIKRMKNNENIGVFPAGTRSSKHLAFKPQVINLAMKNEKTILPLSISDTNLVLEDRVNNKVINTTLTFYPPIKQEDYANKSVEEMCQELEQIIYA